MPLIFCRRVGVLHPLFVESLLPKSFFLRPAPSPFGRASASKRIQKAALIADMTQSLQDRFAPLNACFGCGPANKKGLRIKSMVSGEEVVADWHPESHHEAFPGMLNGGIIGALLDCHCNWTAAWHLMQMAGVDRPPCTVTAEYSIKLLRPTPSNACVHLIAKVAESKGDRAVIEGRLEAEGKITATCTGTFVAVREGHPAFHRW